MAAASPPSISAHLKLFDGPRPGASFVGTDSSQGLHFPPGCVIRESLGTPRERKMKSVGAEERGRDGGETHPPGLENGGRFLEQIFTDAGAACLRSGTAGGKRGEGGGVGGEATQFMTELDRSNLSGTKTASNMHEGALRDTCPRTRPPPHEEFHWWNPEEADVDLRLTTHTAAYA